VHKWGSIHPAEKADAVHRRTAPFCNVKPADCRLPAGSYVRFTGTEGKKMLADSWRYGLYDYICGAKIERMEKVTNLF
jgi:hypothetical protein